MLAYVYGALCLLGTALPFTQFVPWLSANGPNLLLAIAQITGDRLSAFAWADVLVSAVALIIFIVVEGRHLKMRNIWAPIAGTCLVGVSLGLPLFLLMRHRLLARSLKPSPAARFMV